jgi:hypothetical protein
MLYTAPNLLLLLPRKRCLDLFDCNASLLGICNMPSTRMPEAHEMLDRCPQLAARTASSTKVRRLTH